MNTENTVTDSVAKVLAENAVTVEQCKYCWQRGSFRNGETIEGQRHRNGMG